VTAHFSSPSGAGAYSIQSQTTFPSIVLSQFSGNYLFDNDVFKSSLDITFNQSLDNISFTFATVEYHGGPVAEPSNIQLTAYVNSTATTPVGSALARGTWPTSDTYPQGTLTFDSGGQPFNVVRIEIPYQPQGASVFLADYVVVNATGNRPPVAADDAYTASQDAALSVPASGVLSNDTDANGNALTAVLVASVGHGTLTLNPNGSFVYTPSAGYSGADSFAYKANDGTLDSNVATVSITVSAGGNAPPVAVDDAYTTSQGKLLNQAAPGVLANDTDANGNALTAVLITSVSHGTVALNPTGSFFYTPAANFNGADSFTYKASDGMAQSNVATVSITVNPVSNTAPTAVDDAYSAFRNTVLDIGVPGVLANDSDADGDPLTAILASNVSHGSLTFNPNGSFKYTPDYGYTGGDSFTYKVNDGPNETTATVSITVKQQEATIVSIKPSHLRLNQSGTVIIAGDNLDGVTEVGFGDGVTVVTFSVDSSNQITAKIVVDSGAETGARDVTVVSVNGTSTMPEAFEIRQPSSAFPWLWVGLAVGLAVVVIGLAGYLTLGRRAQH
jgi:VCBS repeat-containing protein